MSHTKKKLRIQKEKPIQIDIQNSARNSRMDKAITYIRNRCKTPGNYLEAYNQSRVEEANG